MDTTPETLTPILGKRTPFLRIEGLAALLFLAIAGLFWLPTGLNVGLQGDGWVFYDYAQYGFHVLDLSRPFVTLPSAIAYALTPGNFIATNLMMLVLITARAWLTFAIVREFKFSTGIALAAGLLALVIPADRGLFFVGASAVYFANVCTLAAFYLLLRYWQRPRLLTLCILWIAQILSLLTYEVAYPLILVAPIVIYLQRRRFDARFRHLLFVWYVFPFILALRYPLLIQSSAGLSYQKTIFQSPTVLGLANSLLTIYLRQFVTTWFARDFAYQPTMLIYGVAVGVVAFLICWRTYSPVRSSISYGIVILGALVFVFLSISLYLLTTQQTSSIRLYFVSSAAAAVAITLVLAFLLRSRAGFALAIALFMGIGTLRLLDQHLYWTQIADQQNIALAKLASAAHDFTPQTGIVIIDKTGELKRTFEASWYFNSATTYLYNHPNDIQFAICTPADLTHICKFSDAGVMIYFTDPRLVWNASYDRVVVLTYDGGEFKIDPSPTEYMSAEQLALYHPLSRVRVDVPLPERLAPILAGS